MATKIRCAASDCIFYDMESGCCTAKSISLGDAYIHTVYNGVQHVNTCRSYHLSPEVETLASQLKEVFAFGEAKQVASP